MPGVEAKLRRAARREREREQGSPGDDDLFSVSPAGLRAPQKPRPGFEPGLLDSKSKVLTTTPTGPQIPLRGFEPRPTG